MLAKKLKDEATLGLVGRLVAGPRPICLGEMGEMGLDRDFFRGGDVRPDPGLALGTDSGFLRKDSPVDGCPRWQGEWRESRCVANLSSCWWPPRRAFRFRS